MFIFLIKKVSQAGVPAGHVVCRRAGSRRGVGGLSSSLKGAFCYDNPPFHFPCYLCISDDFQLVEGTTGQRPTGQSSTGQRPTGQGSTGQRPTGQSSTRGCGRKFYLGAELIKCIDPNEGEALRRGGLGTSLPEPGGLKDIPAPTFKRGGPPPPRPTPYVNWTGCNWLAAQLVGGPWVWGPTGRGSMGVGGQLVGGPWVWGGPTGRGSMGVGSNW